MSYLHIIISAENSFKYVYKKMNIKNREFLNNFKEKINKDNVYFLREKNRIGFI